MDGFGIGDLAACGVVARPGCTDGLVVSGWFEVVCLAPDGAERWRESFPNTVVTVGRNDFLDKYFRGSAYTAAFYVGLKGAGTVAGADTMASHSGWAELTGYSNSTRPAFTAAAATSGSNSSSASPASFTINATATVAGCMITTDSTKGGTTGTLFSAADFPSPRSVINGDTLNVTYGLITT